jgi:hypothetical protein
LYNFIGYQVKSDCWRRRIDFFKDNHTNLKVGVRLAFDNTFGFPMLYPGLVVDWAIDGKGSKYFARLNPNEIKAGKTSRFCNPTVGSLIIPFRSKR